MIIGNVVTLVPKVWGYEKILINTELYCGKILTVLPNGKACSLHYHKKKIETFNVTRGPLSIEIYGAREDLTGVENPILDMFIKTHMFELTEGETITIDPFTPHRFWTKSGEIAEFTEFSTHDDPNDSYRLIPAGPIPSWEF